MAFEDYDESQIKRIVELHDALQGSDDTRLSHLELIKKVDPRTAIPELDSRAAAREEADKLREEMRKRDEEDKKARWGQWRDYWRAKLKEEGRAPEAVKAIEDMIESQRVFTYEDGAKIYDAEQALAAPTPSQTLDPRLSPGKVMSKEDFSEEILQDPWGWGDKLAHERLQGPEARAILEKYKNSIPTRR